MPGYCVGIAGTVVRERSGHSRQFNWTSKQLADYYIWWYMCISIILGFVYEDLVGLLVKD